MASGIKRTIQLAGTHKRPPVDKWNPGRVGEIDIVLRADSA